MSQKHKLQPQPKKVGAPKGHVGNPEGKNQFEGILAEKPIAVRLYQEDDVLLRSLAESKDKGFVGQFTRDAVRKALIELDEEFNPLDTLLAFKIMVLLREKFDAISNKNKLVKNTINNVFQEVEIEIGTGNLKC